MTRSILLLAALAAAVLAGAAAPAFAVSIKHTNRVEGDPDAAPRAAAAHATPPSDTTGPRYFDKAHENGSRG